MYLLLNFFAAKSWLDTGENATKTLQFACVFVRGCEVSLLRGAGSEGSSGGSFSLADTRQNLCAEREESEELFSPDGFGRLYAIATAQPRYWRPTARTLDGNDGRSRMRLFQVSEASPENSINPIS